MPGRNGTGPLGLGPMTGRGAGFCAGRNRESGPANQSRSPGLERNSALQGLLVSGLAWLVYAVGSAIGRALERKLAASLTERLGDADKQTPALLPESNKPKGGAQ